MKRYFLTMSLVIAGLFTIAPGANAQRFPEERGRRYEREPLDRVRADLDRASRDLHYLSGPELRRFNKVREEIGEFQRKWERGRFDKGELDDVIGSLQRVVDRNRLQPRDRDLLIDDLNRLRDFRSRYGSRY